MKQSLKDLIKNTLILKFRLPDKGHSINRSCITSVDLEDNCYSASDLEDLARIIYEGILYYSFDEYQLDGGNHQKMFLKAFNQKFKYNYNSTDLAKRKLGIYGESLLYSFLKVFYRTDTLISRGYFYDIQKKSEVTGYDAFHLVPTGENIELWFGETKFYEDGKSAIDSVFSNIQKALSDDYLVDTNFATILQFKGNIKDKESKLYKILEKWEKSIIDSLEAELNDNNISLVYPILVTYNKHGSNFNDSIQMLINHIAEKYSDVTFDDISINYSLFFIFLPIDCVRTTKETVIKWIDNKEPLKL